MTRSISSRSRFVFMMGAVLGLGLMSADAEAKKKRKKGAPTHIRMTGVKSFDTVFKQARKANNKLKAAQSDLRESKVALRAAGPEQALHIRAGTARAQASCGWEAAWIDGGRVQLGLGCRPQRRQEGLKRSTVDALHSSAVRTSTGLEREHQDVQEGAALPQQHAARARSAGNRWSLGFALPGRRSPGRRSTTCA